MTTRLFVSCAAACLISATIFADSQPPTAPRHAANRVKVSGCVERVDQTQSAAATTVDSSSFVLIKSRPMTPVGTSGTVRGAADSTTTNSDRLYRLDAPIEQLNPHVGQR